MPFVARFVMRIRAVLSAAERCSVCRIIKAKGKQDQVNGDFVLVKSNKNGGAVRAAAKGNDIDRFTSNFL